MTFIQLLLYDLLVRLMNKTIDTEYSNVSEKQKILEDILERVDLGMKSLLDVEVEDALTQIRSIVDEHLKALEKGPCSSSGLIIQLIVMMEA